MKLFSYLAVIFFVVIMPASVNAMSQCDSLSSYYDQQNPNLDDIAIKFNSNKNKGCYGNKSDETPWVIEFNQTVSSQEPSEIINTSRRGVAYLLEHLDSSTEMPKAKLLRRALNEWTRTLNGGEKKALRTVTHPDNWSYDAGDFEFGPSAKP